MSVSSESDIAWQSTQDSRAVDLGATSLFCVSHGIPLCALLSGGFTLPRRHRLESFHSIMDARGAPIVGTHVSVPSSRPLARECSVSLMEQHGSSPWSVTCSDTEKRGRCMKTHLTQLPRREVESVSTQPLASYSIYTGNTGAETLLVVQDSRHKSTQSRYPG